METAEAILKICQKLKIQSFIFKASYTKDNRSSHATFQGPGLKEGTRILKKVKEAFGIPVNSDIHYRDEAERAAEVLDMIQIPAYLSMQTQLTLAAAKTGRAIHVKKGQFLDPHDIQHVIKKIESTGNKNILLTERGTFFGYHNLVVDMRNFPIMRSYGYPVCADPTHAIRLYGKSSSDPAGGEPQFIPHLSRASVAAGVDAIFIETHPDTRNALCDAASMLPLQKLESLLEQVLECYTIFKKWEDFKVYE
jgi:2-dehydro-3-deoxyphosphooctonate aldolase (KDO 8-P synthase)